MRILYLGSCAALLLSQGGYHLLHGPRLIAESDDAFH
jgi:hypothetical protein